jgi:hypothetical protein
MNCLKIRKKTIAQNAIGRALGLGLSLPLLLAAPAAFAALELGPAADFAVFQMGSTTSVGSWTSSNVQIGGPVGFRDTNPGGNANTIVSNNVIGSITSSSFASRNWTLVGGTYTQTPDATLQAIAQQARDFSAAAVAAGAGLPNIGSIGNASGSFTFTSANLAEPGTYIVSATGLSLTGGNNFTLNGSQLPAGSRVILNVASGFSLSGGSQVNVIGLNPDQVLINYTGTSAAGASGGSAGTAIFGTFLAPNANVNFNAAATVIHGSLISMSVNLSSGITILGIPFIPEPSPIIAGALLLVPFGASALRIVRKC